jgi:hypothetical protein
MVAFFRFRRTGSLGAAFCAAFLAAAAVAAYGSAAQSPQLGSLSTVNLCVHRAGPEKGAVRFVEKRRYCKANELGVQVLGAGSSQAALGLSAVGALPAASRAASPQTRYVRVEAVSSNAAGTPEAAAATVACPSGAVVLGGGFRVNAGEATATNNPAEVSVVESRASSDASWAVTAFADDAEQVGPWSVAAYAVCADTTG